MHPEGLEPPTCGSVDTRTPDRKSPAGHDLPPPPPPPAAPVLHPAPADPELARVIAAWPNLTPPLRAAVLALVAAHAEGGDR